MFKKAFPAGMFFCFFFLTTNSIAQSEHITVLAFGDSITQGLARKYDGDGNKITWGIEEPPMGRITKDWGYPIELDRRIEEQLHLDLGRTSPFSATVYNWGHRGWSSTAPLECEDKDKQENCIDTVIASQDADYMLILFGSNDLYQGVSAATTKFNLDQMTTKCRDANIAPVIGTLPPNTDTHAFFKQEDIDTLYNPMIRDLADEKELLLADHYSAMVLDWQIWTSGDGLHLNQEGNEKMAETWYSALLQSDFPQASLSPILTLLLND